MDNYVTLFTLLIVLIMAIGLPIIYKKYDLNYVKIYDILNSFLDIFSSLNKNLDYKYKDVMQLIIEYSKLAVNYAEQLYLKGEITAEERKAVAINYMEQTLALQEVEITEQIKSIIKATIEAAVFVLPKTHNEELNEIDLRD